MQQKRPHVIHGLHLGHGTIRRRAAVSLLQNGEAGEGFAVCRFSLVRQRRYDQAHVGRKIVGGQPAQLPATACVVQLVQAVEEHGQAARLPRFHGALEVLFQLFDVVAAWKLCSIG